MHDSYYWSFAWMSLAKLLLFGYSNSFLGLLHWCLCYIYKRELWDRGGHWNGGFRSLWQRDVQTHSRLSPGGSAVERSIKQRVRTAAMSLAPRVQRRSSYLRQGCTQRFLYPYQAQITEIITYHDLRGSWKGTDIRVETYIIPLILWRCGKVTGKQCWEIQVQEEFLQLDLNDPIFISRFKLSPAYPQIFHCLKNRSLFISSRSTKQVC